MANNTHKYGFRWAQGIQGDMPRPLEYAVADSYQAQDDGSGFSVDLNVGDPVKLVSTGTVALANTTNAVFGIIVGIVGYYDSTVGAYVHSNKIPGASTGGGIEARLSRVLVVPAKSGLWEIDVDEASTATTEAAYRALIHENVTHTCAGNSTTKRAEPRIDISTHATTYSLVWRIMGISKTAENRDFSGTNVKLIVACNVSQEAGATAAADNSIVAGV